MMAMSVIRLVGTNKMSLTTNKCSGGGIHKARNNIAADFLKSKCQKMFWWDSDISFEPDQIFNLWNRNLPIVGIPYCHKKSDLEWSARSIEGVGPNDVGLQKVAAAGTGALMVDRGVYEGIIAKFGDELRFIEDWNEGKGETRYDFFKEGVVHDPEFGYKVPTFLSEDFYFCYLARKAGFDIMMDCTSFAMHWEGSKGYPEKSPAPPPDPMPDHVSETDILNFQR